MLPMSDFEITERIKTGIEENVAAIRLDKAIVDDLARSILRALRAPQTPEQYVRTALAAWNPTQASITNTQHSYLTGAAEVAVKALREWIDEHGPLND